MHASQPAARRAGLCLAWPAMHGCALHGRSSWLVAWLTTTAAVALARAARRLLRQANVTVRSVAPSPCASYADALLASSWKATLVESCTMMSGRGGLTYRGTNSNGTTRPEKNKKNAGPWREQEELSLLTLFRNVRIKQPTGEEMSSAVQTRTARQCTKKQQTLREHVHNPQLARTLTPLEFAWKEMMARVTVGAGELSIIHAGPSGVSDFATPPRGLLSPLVQQRHERLYKFTPPRGLLSTLQQRHGRPYKFHTATTSLASTDQATMDLSGDLGVRCSYGLPLLLLWHSQHDT
jgi:hypothetical protein